MTDIGLARGVKTLLDINLNLQAGEDVVVVTDPQRHSIAEAIAFGACERGAEVTLITMLRRTRHGEEPPAPIAQALSVAQAALLPTTYSLTHSKAVRAARHGGCRVLSLPGIIQDSFYNGSLEVDFLQLHTLTVEVGKVLTAAREARVLSGEGSVLTVPLAGRPSFDQTGICHEPGTLGVPPNIETAVSPLEGATFGTLSVDGVVVPGGPVASPVAVHFESGRITAIEGGADADRLRALLQGYDDPNVFCPVELGLGLNPKARMGRGSLQEDEGQFGSLHIGLGEGASFGSSIHAKAHIDLVVRAPTLELDGKTVLQNKAYTLPGLSFTLGKGGELETQ